MPNGKNPLRPPDPNLPFTQSQSQKSWTCSQPDMSIGSLVRLDLGMDKPNEKVSPFQPQQQLSKDQLLHQQQQLPQQSGQEPTSKDPELPHLSQMEDVTMEEEDSPQLHHERDAINRIKKDCELKSQFLRRPHELPSNRPTTLPLNEGNQFAQKLFSSKSAGQFNTSEGAAMSIRDPFDEARHNEMKLRPKHYQHIAMNMSRAQLDKDRESESLRQGSQIKQSKSEPIVQRHLESERQSVEETRESRQSSATRKSQSRIKDIDKIGEKMRERSAPRSSLDESGSSRKSSISSGRKKFISGGKEFAVTLFVNEADKNKILEMLHRAKCVISKKVEKVMGRKTTKAEISDTDALKTVLQNWVEEEEIKSVQEEAEMEGLIEEQVKQVDQMRQLGLSPPVELRPVATVIDQVTEEGDEDAEGIDTVHEADIEVQELFESRQERLRLPTRNFHLSRSATPTTQSMSARSLALAPCDNVPRPFSRPESELYPPKLRRPSSLYDWNAQAASSRPVSRQDLLFSLQPESPPASSGSKPVAKVEEKPEPKWITRPGSMTIPIGGVWRPGDSDNEEEDSNFFFGNTKPKPDPETAIESCEETVTNAIDIDTKENVQLFQNEELDRGPDLKSLIYQDPPDVIPRLKRSALDPEIDRYIRRVSYLKATKEERSQADSDQDETDQSKIQELDQSTIHETDQSKIHGAEEGSKEQVHSIQKILSVFTKKTDGLPSPTTETSKLDDFSKTDFSLEPVKEGWLEFQLIQSDKKKSEEWIWNNVYVVLRTTAIYFYKDKKTAYETPLTYEHYPMSLSEITVEAICESVFKRKFVFRLKCDVADDYNLVADCEQSMLSWIQALEDAISIENAKKRGSRKSLTARNRSPSVQSHQAKNRKGSSDTGQQAATDKESKKTWKGKVAKQWRKMQGTSGVTLSAYPEGGSIGVPLEECPVCPEPGLDRIPLLVKISAMLSCRKEFGKVAPGLHEVRPAVCKAKNTTCVRLWVKFLLCLQILIEGWPRGRKTNGQPPPGHSETMHLKKKKKMNQVHTFPKFVFFYIGLPYLILTSTLVFQSVHGMISQSMHSHHVIFDNLGQLSTGVTYINVAVPLNISILYNEIEIFEDYLESILRKNQTLTNSTLKHETINAQNMDTLIKGLATYAKSRLTSIFSQLQSVDKLLPIDPTFDKTNARHKRFVFLAPMIVCEVDRSWYKNNITETKKEMDALQNELDTYKQEYARLYDATLPDLIPKYVEDNYDQLDTNTISKHVEYLTRTKRDVQFLLNVIDQERKHPKEINHKPRNINSTFMKPDRNFNDKDKFFQPYKHASRTKYLKFLRDQTKIPTLTEHFEHQYSIPNSSTPLHNRDKRFIVESIATLAVGGVLGTFLGIFNAIELTTLRQSMVEMQDSHNLLVQIQKTQEHQITDLKSGINHLEEIFSIFIKNNPALLYAKFNDLLTTLQQHIYNLQDTLQMLQLQRFSTNTLSSTELYKLYDQILTLARTNNLSPLTNQAQDLFQLDTSYLRIKNEILILIHVPCSNPSSLLSIYKYVPFPIPVKSNNFNSKQTTLNTIQDVFDISAPTSDIATEGIQFQADADLIAIGKNNNNKHRYILLSTPDLAACTKRSHAYICERHQVTKSDLLGSCLGSLYLQDSLGVASNCKINRVELRETVYQISNTQHIVFTPIPITTQITCINGSYFPLKIKHTKQIYIPDGCSVELINHTITSDYSIRATSDSIHFEWDFDPVSLPNTASLMLDSKSIDSKLELIKLSVQAVKNDTIDDVEFDNLMVSHYTSGSWMSILIICALSLAGVVAVITILVCVRNYFLAGGMTGANTASSFKALFHRQQSHEESDSDEDEISRIARTGRTRDTPPLSRSRV